MRPVSIRPNGSGRRSAASPLALDREHDPGASGDRRLAGRVCGPGRRRAGGADHRALAGPGPAGQDGFFDDAGLPVGDGWDQTELPRAKDTLFSLRITGDSMSPLYREGDRVIVDQEATQVRRGDRVVARLTSGEVVAKEVTSLTSRTVTLASINPDYPPRIVPRREIEWMARILWVSQ
jgi:phage repressor protein C with HTH and peptisase S24 domain